jgi:hypothetical protein
MSKGLSLLLALALAALGLASGQDQGPEIVDVTVAGKKYDVRSGTPLQLYREDLVRGQAIVRGKVNPHGSAETLAVQVSIDDGKTWHPASGVQDWSFAFRPAAGVRYVVRARIVALKAAPPPDLQLKLELLEILDEFGEAIVPISGKYLYSGAVHVRGKVRNAGAKPASGLSVAWDMEGKQGTLLPATSFAAGESKELSAKLPDLGGLPRSLHLIALRGKEVIGGQAFQFVPAQMKKQGGLALSSLQVFEIDPKTGVKNEVAKTAGEYATSPGKKYWIAFEIANQGPKPQFNVPIAAWSNTLPSGSAGGSGWANLFNAKLAFIPPGGKKGTGLEVDASAVNGVLNMLFGDEDSGGSYSAQFGNATLPGLKPMKVRLASVEFYVEPHVDFLNPGKSAALEKFWGKGRILAPLGSLPSQPVAFMMESATASVAKGGDIQSLATVWGMPMPGQGLPMVQYGNVSYRLQRMDLHMPMGIAKTGGGWVGLVGSFVHSMAGEFKCDLPVVTNLHDFHGVVPGQLFMLAKGQMALDSDQVYVDFSPSWSPTTPPVGKMGAGWQIPPIWKGAMATGGKASIQPAALGFPADAGVIQGAGHFVLIEEEGIRGLVHVPGHLFTLSGFKLGAVGMAELDNDSFKPFKPTKAAAQLPAWLSAAPGLVLEDPQNKIAEGKVDLYNSKPALALQRESQGVKVTLPAHQYIADFSVVRGHPSLPPAWVGLFCEAATIEYKGEKTTAPVQVGPGEWTGAATFGGTEKKQGGISVKEGTTLVKLVGAGAVEVVSDASGLLLPPGVFVIKQAKYEGPIGGQWMDGAALSGDIPGPWTFAFGGVRVSVDKAKLTAEGLELGAGWFLPPAEVSAAWVAHQGTLLLKAGSFGGQLQLAGLTWSPPGWGSLVLGFTSSTAVIEKSSIVKISTQGTVKLGPNVDAVPLGAKAAFLPSTPGHLGFVDATKGPKIDLPGGVFLEAGMDLHLDWNQAVGGPSGSTGVWVKTGKLRAPPLLASASIPYESIEIAPSGVKGDVAFVQSIVSTPAPGVTVDIEKGALHFSDGKLSGGKLDGSLSFPFDGTTLTAAFNAMTLEADAAGSKFGLVGTGIATNPAPFPYKGMHVSISKIDVDVSEVSSFSGAASWKGIRIVAGTLQLKLAVPSKSGDPVAFSMENTTFQFGGGLNGQFKVAAPVDLELLDPKGFRLEIAGGWIQLSNGAISGQSLDGACALPTQYAGLNPRAQFKGASIGANGDLFAADAKFLDAKFGPYTFGSGKVTVDLSAAQSPPGRPAGWKGLLLQNAWFTFGQFGEKLFFVDGQTMAADGSGLSAKIAVSTNQAGEYGGFNLAVTQVSFDIADSQILNGKVQADLKLPQPRWKGILKLSLDMGPTGIESGSVVGSGIAEIPGLGLKVAPFAAKLTTFGAKGWVEMGGLLGLGGQGLEVSGVAFQNLRLQHTGHVQFGTGGAFYLPKTIQGKFHGYPIAIERIEFGTDGAQSVVSVGGMLEISEVIPAKYVEAKLLTAPTGSQPKASCESIAISGSWSGVSFEGTVHFFDDPTKGRGFEGDLALKVSAGVDFSLDGKFLSATVADYRYWRIGAKLQLPAGSGIPIGSTGLSIYGFQGGFAYNMKVSTADGSFAPQKGGWVFSAGATIGTADDGYTLNADAVVSISSGPVFMFEGDFWMLCPRQARTDRIRGGVKIVLGGGALKGSAWAHAEFYGAVKADGSIEFYFPTSGSWYIRLGTKESPIAATVLNGPTGKAWVTIGSHEFTIGAHVDVIKQGGSVGPLSGEIRISVGGEVSVQRNPFHFSGSVWASGHVKGSIEIDFAPDPSVTVGVSGWLNVNGPDPTSLSGGIWVGVSVCGVSIGGNFKVSKTW